MLIATWNVNSIRSRIDHVKEWLIENKPDILCLQETKVEDKDFPVEAFADLGYQISINGQKSYNGVAIISLHSIDDVQIGFEDVILKNKEATHLSEQKRVISALVNDIRIINVYVPNGSSLDSEKFNYKKKWMSYLKLYLEKYISSQEPICLLGDFNIAPEDKDIHSPNKFKERIMASSIERKLLKNVIGDKLEDVFRIFEPGDNHWTWWDYRHSAWEKNKGWRIDHIYITEELLSSARSCWIDKKIRSNHKPSDHVPVVLDIAWPFIEEENESSFEQNE